MRFTGPRCAAVFIIQIVLIKGCSCIILAGFVATAVAAASVGVFTAAYINYFERSKCDAVMLDSKGLFWDMNTKLHGQHLVIPTVIKSIRVHTNDPNPGKALVLSFHGWTGGGKNFVTQIIRDNLYKNAGEHFHLFNSEIHFKHESDVAKYKDTLHLLINETVSNCARSMFVFDEMDHMPTGLIDVLTPFLSHNTEIDGVDFRKTIFIFLSNTGGNKIMDIVFKHWKDGKMRDSLKLSEMQPALEMVAFNEKSGLKGSAVIKKNLIDHFVPFLPLEREHVKRCIDDLVKQKGYKGITDDISAKVLDELGWQPKKEKIFSKTGCKKIEQNVAIELPED